jgi:hypothetical protein
MKVKLKDGEEYLVHDVKTINGKKMYSLGLKDYPDTEQDYYTNENEVMEVIK